MSSIRTNSAATDVGDEWKTRLPSADTQQRFYLAKYSYDEPKVEKLRAAFDAKLSASGTAEGDLDEGAALQCVAAALATDAMNLKEFRALCEQHHVPISKRISFLEFVCLALGKDWIDLHRVRAVGDTQIEEAMGDLLLAKLKQQQARESARKLDRKRVELSALEAQLAAGKSAELESQVSALRGEISAMQLSINKEESSARQGEAAALARRSAAEDAARVTAEREQSNAAQTLADEQAAHAAAEVERKARVAEKLNHFKSSLGAPEAAK